MAGNRRWNQNEIDFLKANYGITDVKVIAKKLQRSVDSVHWKASHLDIKYDPSNVIFINKRLDDIDKKMNRILEFIECFESTKRRKVVKIKRG